MKITRYIVNGGSVMLQEDESYEHGQCLWVRDSDYSKLQSQLTALASQLESVVAENAALKAAESNLVRNIINDLGDTEFQYAKVQTPATAAVLAEVRASGVDDFLRGSQLPYQIATVLADFDNVDDATLQTVIWSGQPPEPDGDVWHLEYVSRGNAIVRAVSKQLRQGGAV